MSKNIVFGFEDSLIARIQDKKIIHPDANDILKLASNDFDNVFVWSNFKLDFVSPILKTNNLLKYIDGIVSFDYDKNSSYHLITYFDTSNINFKTTIDVKVPRSNFKSLDILGDTRDFVAMFAIPSFVKPVNRCISFKPYTLFHTPDLKKYYQDALDLSLK